MKLRISNLGRIEDAEIDFRPLTVLVGKNGTGKTWTAHAYFKLLERLRVGGGRSERLIRGGPLDKVADAVADDWHEKLDATTTGSASFSVNRADLIARLPDSVTLELGGGAWVSTLGTPLPRARAELSISRDELEKGVGSRLDLTITKAPLKIEKTLTFSGVDEPSTSTQYGNTLELRAELRAAVSDLLCAWRMQVRALPAERVNLAQIFPVLIRDKDIPMPRALVDFCWMMSIASFAQAEPRHAGLVDALAKITGGRTSFEDKKLVFRPDGAQDVALPIKAAASLVKSMAGLAVFLSTAVPGDVLIIDEPEMNAHPEAQVGLMELFAAMVRSGIHVVVATHSPYVLDHLSTLMEASRLSDAQRESVRGYFELGSAQVYLQPEEVAVYQFEPLGVVRSIFDREAGVVNWSTFTAVSERESRTVNAVIEAESEVSGDAP